MSSGSFSFGFPARIVIGLVSYYAGANSSNPSHLFIELHPTPVPASPRLRPPFILLLQAHQQANASQRSPGYNVDTTAGHSTCPYCQYRAPVSQHSRSCVRPSGLPAPKQIPFVCHFKKSRPCLSVRPTHCWCASVAACCRPSVRHSDGWMLNFGRAVESEM